MKKIIKFNLLIFLFISVFSIPLFAKWEINIDNDLMFIMNFDNKYESVLDTSIADNWLSAYDNHQIAVVLLYSDKIISENELYLRIKKKSNNYITYSISDKDVIEDNESTYIGIGINTDDGIRANNLINILLDSLEVELYSNDELLGYFNLKGLREALEENLGDTEWYIQKIKN
ncbi:hypothetical protein [Brachyspira murdochii]|uniref:Uncharacterized protein n=1 Tax=Brachyspira murdochii (strain ATCC 51284 / DSM 12563 / 56-150) TaxID=526224 RepID=D5U3K2_BRAM5|nr:hypothetical protein [Brachyspira murdochii]ADG72084.1 hypothetical protein Bmur_2007 [Brachyspira murdochii DSM 12563]